MLNKMKGAGVLLIFGFVAIIAAVASNTQSIKDQVVYATFSIPLTFISHQT